MVRDLLCRQEGSQRMSVCRIALVTEDPRLAAALQAHLTRALGQAVLHCSFTSVRDHLGAGSDGRAALDFGGFFAFDVNTGLALHSRVITTGFGIDAGLVVCCART